MPDLATHTVLASTTANTTAASMVGLAAIAQALGLDLVALFYAFMGAACWRAIQPAIAPTLTEISKAFGWSVLAMIIGCLGAVVGAKSATNYFVFLKDVEPLALLGLLATLLGFFCVPIILKIGEQLKNWRATNVS